MEQVESCIAPARNYTASSMKTFPVLVLLSLAALAAQAQTPPAAAQPAARAPARALPLARGEVLEIDTAQRRALVKHGPIPSLGMDSMTMEFSVPDAALLASFKPGDRIRFAAAYKDGDYVITRAERVKSRAAGRPKTP